MPPRQPELPSVRVERELRLRIEAGEWDHGEQLPPVADLAAQFGVGHGTVARVLAKLAAEQPPLVRVIPRYGAFRI